MESGIHTFYDYLLRAAARNPEKPMLGGPGIWLNCGQVRTKVDAIASRLHSLGLRQGDMAAIQTHRNLETVLLLLAFQAVGAVAVLTDFHKPALPFLAGCHIPVPVKAVIENGGYTDLSTGSFAPLDLLSLPEKPWDTPETDATAPGFLIFTSGSTGKPKAVVLSQYNLISNLVDAAPFGDYRPEDVALGVLPLDHVFGLVLLTGMLVHGYSLYLPGSTDISTILESIATQHITRMNGVPSLYLAMASRKGDWDISSLRTGFLGGEPCSPAQFAKIEDSLGMTLLPAYGMSECVSITIASPADSREKRATTVGKFYPRTTGRILLANGTPAGVDVEGEIWVTSPSRMLGYYGESPDQNPLMPTGDLGYVDKDGFVHISGRKKDIIIRNGNNLSARKIEEALLSLPGIREAAVVGLPHETQGEVPWAMAAGNLSEMTALAQLSGLLAKNELPMGIHMVDALPQTPSGKQDKQRIREVLLQWKA